MVKDRWADPGDLVTVSIFDNKTSTTIESTRWRKATTREDDAGASECFVMMMLANATSNKQPSPPLCTRVRTRVLQYLLQ